MLDGRWFFVTADDEKFVKSLEWRLVDRVWIETHRQYGNRANWIFKIAEGSWMQCPQDAVR